MGSSMLDFAERVLRDIKNIEKDTESLIINGAVPDMERYRFLIGRLEGIRLSEDIIRQRLKKHADE